MSENNALFFEDMHVGMTEQIEKVLGNDEVQTFADLTGDNNPIHLNEEYAATTMFKGRIAHGMLTASLISNILGTKLPGTGAIYLSQSVRFRAPVMVGDTVVVSATVSDMNEKRKIVTLSCQCKVGDVLVLDGEAKVMVSSNSGK